MHESLRRWARLIKRDVYAVWLAARDPRTPWYVQLLALTIAAYAFSPIDLIPDFIPVLGYLDDVILLPLGILLVVRLIPADRLREYREAADRMTRRPVSRTAAVIIIAIWLACAALVVRLLLAYGGR